MTNNCVLLVYTVLHILFSLH